MGLCEALCGIVVFVILAYLFISVLIFLAPIIIPILLFVGTILFLLGIGYLMVAVVCAIFGGN